VLIAELQISTLQQIGVFINLDPLGTKYQKLSGIVFNLEHRFCQLPLKAVSRILIHVLQHGNDETKIKKSHGNRIFQSYHRRKKEGVQCPAKRRFAGQ
jgi:hypothetical protein